MASASTASALTDIESVAAAKVLMNAARELYSRVDDVRSRTLCYNRQHYMEKVLSIAQLLLENAEGTYWRFWMMANGEPVPPLPPLYFKIFPVNADTVKRVRKLADKLFLYGEVIGADGFDRNLKEFERICMALYYRILHLNKVFPWWTAC